MFNLIFRLNRLCSILFLRLLIVPGKRVTRFIVDDGSWKETPKSSSSISGNYSFTGDRVQRPKPDYQINKNHVPTKVFLLCLNLFAKKQIFMQAGSVNRIQRTE